MKNRKLRFIFSALSVLLIICVLSSCSQTGGTQGRLSISQVAEEMIKEIISALDNENADALKTLFSKNAKNGAVNLDEGIEYLMQFYKGKSISLEDQLGSSSGEYILGKESREISWHYIVETELEKYSFYFIVKDNESALFSNKNDVGLFQLIVDVQSNDDCYWFWSLRKDTPGILWNGLLLPEDYLVGALHGLNLGVSQSNILASMFSNKAHEEIKNLLSEIEMVIEKWIGYPTFSDCKNINIISAETVGSQTIYKATCEVQSLSSHTDDSEGRKQDEYVIYCIYFVYIKDPENSDKNGFNTIHIVEKASEDEQYVVDDEIGIFYHGSEFK